MMNINKSIGIEINFDNLDNIENFLTNFNQIVIQQGLINKFFFCFDLPLSILQGSTPSLLGGALSFSPQCQQSAFLKDCSNLGTSLSKQPYTSNGKSMNLLSEFYSLKEAKTTKGS